MNNNIYFKRFIILYLYIYTIENEKRVGVSVNIKKNVLSLADIWRENCFKIIKI